MHEIALDVRITICTPENKKNRLKFAILTANTVPIVMCVAKPYDNVWL